MLYSLSLSLSCSVMVQPTLSHRNCYSSESLSISIIVLFLNIILCTCLLRSIICRMSVLSPLYLFSEAGFFFGWLLSVLLKPTQSCIFAEVPLMDQTIFLSGGVWGGCTVMSDSSTASTWDDAWRPFCARAPLSTGVGGESGRVLFAANQTRV